MKTGKSILLLGELIDASEVEYKDCEYFQIVCPACHEPIFKVVREKENPVKHYFSHYNKDKSQVAECENRVGSYSAEYIYKQRAISREQLIKFFSKIIKKEVLKIYGDLSEEINSAYNNPYLKDLASIQNNILDRKKTQHNYNKIYEVLKKKVHFGNTIYTINVQKDIAQDVFKYLLTPKGYGNFTLVFFISNILGLIRLERQIEELTDGYNENYKLIGEERRAYLENLYFALRSIKNNGKEAKEGFRLLFKKQKWSHGEFSYHDVWSETIFLGMVEVLLRLPYFEMLREGIEKGLVWRKKNLNKS